MTERSYPFVDGATTDAEFSAMFRNVFPASVIDGLAVSADSSGMQVKLPAGSGFVRGHYYKNTDEQTLTIDAGDSNPRIDTVVLRLEYGTANSISAQVKKGTAATDPTAPALTQTDVGVFEFELADVRVAANAVTVAAGDVTDRRVMYATAFKQYMGLLNMAASVITSGTFEQARIPSLPASKITSGQFDIGRVPYMSDSTTLKRAYFASDPSGLGGNGIAYVALSGDGDVAFFVNRDNSVVFQVDKTGKISVGTIDWSAVTGKPSLVQGNLANEGNLLNLTSGGYINLVVGGQITWGVSPQGELQQGSVPTARLQNIHVRSTAPSNPAVDDVWIW